MKAEERNEAINRTLAGLGSINVILSSFAEPLSKFSRDLFDIAESTGQTFNTVAHAAEQFSAQGLTWEETIRRTKDALILARLSGLSATESVGLLTSALQTFTTESDSTKILDKLIVADQNFAVSTRDLCEALDRCGNTAKDAGVSFEELIALISLAQERTSRGGAVIGNSLRILFSRLQSSMTRLKLIYVGVPFKLDGPETGIEVLDLAIETYKNGNETQRRYIAEILGGVYYMNIIRSILSS